LGQGITGRVALSGEPYLAADVTLDPSYLAGFSETRSELCVPLRVGERIIGVINVESPQVAAYGWQDQQLLMTLAGQLATAIEKLRLRQRLRDDLTHLMVHDLRNPLTSILSALSLLMTRFDGRSAEQERLIGLANRGAQQLLKLVNAILDTTRLENGQLPLKREPLSVVALVEDVIHSQMALAEEKGLYLEKELPAGLPVVSADGDLLGRLLQNLVGNAIKFTPRGGSIWIGANPTPDDGRDRVTLFVRDTGPGVPLELQNHLFQKFVTGGQAGHGSGLGLAFCRLAAEAHGGRAWLESEPGKGATFYVSLPL
jgi:signal transduction histidine kinase